MPNNSPPFTTRKGVKRKQKGRVLRCKTRPFVKRYISRCYAYDVITAVTCASGGSLRRIFRASSRGASGGGRLRASSRLHSG